MECSEAKFSLPDPQVQGVLNGKDKNAFYYEHTEWGDDTMNRLNFALSILMGFFVLMGMANVARAQTTTKDRSSQKHCGKCKCCKIYKHVLPLFDKDSSGGLDKAERTAAKAYVKREIEKRRVKKYDRDGDGELSDAEKEAAKKARKAKQLKKYDKNGNGKLDKKERKKMSKGSAKKCSCPKRKKDRSGKKKKKKKKGGE